MKRHIEHLKRELKHKWFVFIECCKLGIPWLGLVHDWSKFTPSEFGTYARNFYTKDGVQLPKRETISEEYKVALLHHYNANKHHPEYWVLFGESLPIPSPYREEMLADWLGYEMTNGIQTKLFYYKLKNKGKIKLHSETQKWVEAKLDE